MASTIELLVSAGVGFAFSILTQLLAHRFDMRRVQLQWEHDRKEKTQDREMEQIGQVRETLSGILLILQGHQVARISDVEHRLVSVQRNAAALVANSSIYLPISRMMHRLRVARKNRETLSGSSLASDRDYNPFLDEVISLAYSGIDACERELGRTPKPRKFRILDGIRKAIRKRSDKKRKKAKIKVMPNNSLEPTP